ncbi:unnamed protein product [Periconia digitata]|uniref:Rhodopsin domain-containing protein n=1 Tax=Periconia digitata TaxID=1303443 RepID=A0A9W4UNR2_9PLEO|nr:unnamed protein product [Periconia digitata]
MDFAATRHAYVVRHRGSDSDSGPFVNVVTWIMLITSTLAVLTRLVTKRALRRRIDVDDAFVAAALLASIGSGVAVTVQTKNGLGRSKAMLDPGSIPIYEKAEYANKLLYIATLALAKLSIISLLMILTASDLHRNMGIALTAMIALWGLVSEFTAAFQCGIDRPWQYSDTTDKCLSMIKVWLGVAVGNMITDLFLVLFPIHIILTLQMSMKKKITILCFFGSRSLDIVATAIQLSYVPDFHSPDPTRALWTWTLTTQVIECLTILTSCVPYLRPLLEDLLTGLYAVDELRRRGNSTSSSRYARTRNNGESYKLSSTNSFLHPWEKRAKRSHSGESGIRRFLPTLSEVGTNNANSASGLPGGPKRSDGRINVEITARKDETASELGKWETESTGSQAKIVKTTVMSAEWEERQSNRQSDDDITVLRTDS